jgi:hypothetical protein
VHPNPATLQPGAGDVIHHQSNAHGLRGREGLAGDHRENPEGQPKDVDHYEFALKQAIETARDSLDLSQEDLNARSATVQVKEEKEKKDRKAMMGTKETEDKKAAEKKTAADLIPQRRTEEAASPLRLSAL